VAVPVLIPDILVPRFVFGAKFGVQFAVLLGGHVPLVGLAVLAAKGAVHFLVEMVQPVVQPPVMPVTALVPVSVSISVSAILGQGSTRQERGRQQDRQSHSDLLQFYYPKSN
jgi:spore maturation protein SpmB